MPRELRVARSIRVMNLGYFIFLTVEFLFIFQSFSDDVRTLDDPHLMKFFKLKEQSIKNTFQSATISISKPKRFSYFGEPCDRNEDCVPNRGLTCMDSTCACVTPQFIARLNSDKTGENHAATECVIRVGFKCGIKINRAFSSTKERETENRALSRFFWNKLRKNVPFLIESVGEHFINSDSNCVDNANCLGGTCRCSQDYFKDSRGLCLKKRTLFQPCEESSVDDQCRASEGLHCYEGKCQCKRSMIFDKSARKCLIPVGGECDAYASNAEEYGMDCVKNAECSNDRCQCLDGFTMSSDGSCGVSHGGLCDGKERACSDMQLTCRSGRCQCRYPVHQTYNETLEECLSKPDGPCIPDREFSSTSDVSVGLKQNCVHLAHCVLIEESASAKKSVFDYTCKCAPGYAEDPEGECIQSYSSSCIEDEDCDPVGQLSCVNGKCACPDGMLTWDETRRKCVGLPGARCKFIQLERILAMRMDIPTECVEDAVCMEHVSRLDGRCECKSGFKFSANYIKCIPAHSVP